MNIIYAHHHPPETFSTWTGQSGRLWRTPPCNMSTTRRDWRILDDGENTQRGRVRAKGGGWLNGPKKDGQQQSTQAELCITRLYLPLPRPHPCRPAAERIGAACRCRTSHKPPVHCVCVRVRVCVCVYEACVCVCVFGTSSSGHTHCNGGGSLSIYTSVCCTRGPHLAAAKRRQRHRDGAPFDQGRFEQSPECALWRLLTLPLVKWGTTACGACRCRTAPRGGDQRQERCRQQRCDGGSRAARSAAAARDTRPSSPRYSAPSAKSNHVVA